MGNRNDWSDVHITNYVQAAHGNLTLAASMMNAEAPEGISKVTRQNLQTWVNDAQPAVGLGDETATTMDNFELARTNRNLTNRNNKLARQLRTLEDAVITKSDVLTSLAQAVSTADPAWPIPPAPKNGKGKGITIELLFSDLQIGKLMDGYDTSVALRRVNEWIEVAYDRILSYIHQGYHVDKIILAVLGDVIESDKKHENSGRGCDIGTAEQMRLGIEVLFNTVIKTLAQIGAPLDVVMITGNHDHDGHGLSMFMPGREHLSWPLYNAVKMLSEQAGVLAKFYIPEGSFHVHKIYGASVLYEHGVGVATSEAAMKSHVAKRINQTKEFIHLYRMGDKHNICRFNNDRLVVNGAFFGDDRIGSDFSGIKGYDGEPAQIMFAYVARTDNLRTPIFDSLSIQLGHVK